MESGSLGVGVIGVDEDHVSNEPNQLTCKQPKTTPDIDQKNQLLGLQQKSRTVFPPSQMNHTKGLHTTPGFYLTALNKICVNMTIKKIGSKRFLSAYSFSAIVV